MIFRRLRHQQAGQHIFQKGQKVLFRLLTGLGRPVVNPTRRHLQRLDVGLLVHTKHQRILRRCQV